MHQQLLLLFCLLTVSPCTLAKTILTVCEWEGYIMPWEHKFKAYAKEHGMDIELKAYPDYLRSPEQIFNLARGQRCDIITPTHNYFSQRNNQLFRSLMPIDFSKIPNYVHVNDSLKILQYKNYHGQNYAIPLLGGSYGLTYNADKVEKPDSFDVLFDPDNKCKTSLTKSQYAANLYLATLKSGYSQDQLYNMESEIFSRGLKDKTVLENLKQLYANVCAQDRFWEGSVNLSLKDLHYGTTYWFGVASAQKQGANWKIAHDVRSTVWLDTISFVPTLKDSPKKLKAAYLLANFMLSDEIQTEIHQTYGVVVVNKRVAQEVTDLSIFFQEEWLWKPLTLRTQAIYKIMHDNVINQLPEHYSPKEN